MPRYYTVTKTGKIRKKPEEFCLDQCSIFLKRFIHPVTHKFYEIEFRIDYSAGMKLTEGQAKKMKRIQSKRGYPDCTILEPKTEKDPCGFCEGIIYHYRYCGLLVELKAGSVHRKRDGLLSKEKHIQEQYARLLSFRKRGYVALFAEGFLHFKDIVNRYMSSEAWEYRGGEE